MYILIRCFLLLVFFSWKIFEFFQKLKILRFFFENSLNFRKIFKNRLRIFQGVLGNYYPLFTLVKLTDVCDANYHGLCISDLGICSKSHIKKIQKKKDLFIKSSTVRKSENIFHTTATKIMAGTKIDCFLCDNLLI